MRLRIIYTLGILFSLLLLMTIQNQSHLSPWRSVSAGPAEGGSAAPSDPVLVGAGDIVECNQDESEATAKLVESIEGTVFILGDNAYNQGTLQQYTDCYDSTWGRFKDRTLPVVGGHEYRTEGAEGYFTYFGSAASPLDTDCTRDCKGYYSLNLGAWHIVVLNSELDLKPGSEQEQWLRADLEKNQAACTLAMWHEPLFSSGEHYDSPETKVFWEVLYEYGADVVLNGHDHNYQRFAPQDPEGAADPRGIRQFVVGTGGADHYGIREKRLLPTLEVYDKREYGVLKLTLHPTSYDWEFIPVPRKRETFRDFGASTCVTDDTQAVMIGTATPLPSPTATPFVLPTLEPTPMVPLTRPALSPWESFMAWLQRLFSRQR